MLRKFVLLASLCLAAARPAAAQVPPTPDALVDRYMAAIPDTTAMHEARDREELIARLRAANPGAVEAVVTAAVDEGQACWAPLIRVRTDRTLRLAVRQLGAEKVTLLIAFYQGPDAGVLRRIIEADSRGALPEALVAEERRLAETYPIAEFAAATRAATAAVRAEPGYEQDSERCATAAAAALARRNLRTPAAQ
jgi:hypothetical protein